MLVRIFSFFFGEIITAHALFVYFSQWKNANFLLYGVNTIEIFANIEKK